MMRASVLGLVVLLSGLVACGDENRTPTHFTPSSDKISTSSNDTTVKPAPAVPNALLPPMKTPPPPDSAAIALSPADTASLRGSGQLAGLGALTAVSVALTQGKAGSNYEGTIRQGVCARMGAAVASLNPVSADSLGRGAASTDVAVPIDSLLGARHVVVYGKGGRAETCGGFGSPPATPPRPALPAARPAATLRVDTAAPPPPSTTRVDSAEVRAG